MGPRCARLAASSTGLPGSPDLAFGGTTRLAVFVDGAFWHGHPSKYWLGRSGKFWDKKIARNMEREVVNEGRMFEVPLPSCMLVLMGAGRAYPDCVCRRNGLTQTAQSWVSTTRM